MSTIHPSAQANQPSPTVATTLTELLAYHDRQFIECAYLTLLNRLPDSVGYVYYLDRLHAGVSKIHILGQLLDSSETRANSIQLPSLRSSVKWQKLARFPLIGSIFKHLFRVDGDSAFEIRLRIIEQQICLSNQNTDSHFDHHEQTLTDLRKLIAQQDKRNLTTLEHIEQQVFISNQQTDSNFIRHAQIMNDLWELIAQQDKRDLTALEHIEQQVSLSDQHTDSHFRRHEQTLADLRELIVQSERKNMTTAQFTAPLELDTESLKGLPVHTRDIYKKLLKVAAACHAEGTY